MFQELRRLFLVGIFAAAPLGLTVYLLVGFFGWFDALFQPLVSPLIRPYYDHPIPGLGIILGTICILLIGVVAPSIMGRQFLQLAEKAVERVPLAKLIYSGTKQIFDSFSSSNMSKFNRVVMVEFPHEGSYAIGFVTRDLESGWVPGHPEKKLAVFVPTTPNPTGGYLIFVSESDTLPLGITVEEALKLVISVGFAKPQSLQLPTAKSL